MPAEQNYAPREPESGQPHVGAPSIDSAGSNKRRTSRREIASNIKAARRRDLKKPNSVESRSLPGVIGAE
jgi:hypothetical protein